MLSSQGKTVLVMQTIQIISVIIAILMSPVSAASKATGVFFSTLFLGIGAYLTFKTINCMVYGECGTFAWIIVGVMLFFFVLAVVSSALGMASLKKWQTDALQSWGKGMAVITPPHIGGNKTPNAEVISAEKKPGNILPTVNTSSTSSPPVVK